jgi:hypothetical protein
VRELRSEGVMDVKNVKNVKIWGLRGIAVNLRTLLAF